MVSAVLPRTLLDRVGSDVQLLTSRDTRVLYARMSRRVITSPHVRASVSGEMNTPPPAALNAMALVDPTF